jgi:hypothetical protein
MNWLAVDLPIFGFRAQNWMLVVILEHISADLNRGIP